MISSISNSKTNLALRAFLFISILFLALLCLRYIRSSSVASVTKGLPSNQERKLSGVINHELDADIAVFGSSVAWVHFNPEVINNETNKTAYNLGFDATTLQQYQGALKEFLTYSKAEVVVLAGSYGELGKRNKIYYPEMYEPYLDNENIYTSLSQIAPSISRLKYVPFYDLIFYQKQYRQILTGQFKEGAVAVLSPAYYTKDIKGFHPVNGGWMEEKWMKQGELNSENMITVEVNNQVINIYRNIISEINKKGKKVILVLTPVYIQGQEGIENLNEVRAAYRSLAGKENYFFDFTKHEICSRKELFYNYAHLNAQGANIFSEEFSKELLKLGII